MRPALVHCSRFLNWSSSFLFGFFLTPLVKSAENQSHFSETMTEIESCHGQTYTTVRGRKMLVTSRHEDIWRLSSAVLRVLRAGQQWSDLLLSRDRRKHNGHHLELDSDAEPSHSCWHLFLTFSCRGTSLTRRDRGWRQWDWCILDQTVLQECNHLPPVPPGPAASALEGRHRSEGSHLQSDGTIRGQIRFVPQKIESF